MNLLISRFSKLLSYRGRVDFDEDKLSKVRYYKCAKVRIDYEEKNKVVEVQIIKGYEFICSDYHIIKIASSK